MSPTAICTPPEAGEIQTRRARVQAAMVAAGIDQLVLSDPDNVFYMTNFANLVHERPFILVLPAKGDPVFVIPFLEEPHVRSRAVCGLEFSCYAEFPALPGHGWADRFREVIAGCARVGIEPNCPYSVLRNIEAEVTATDILDEVRAIKSDYEIGRIQYACNLMSEAQIALLEMARPGVMPISIHSALSAQMMTRQFTDLPSTNVLNTKFSAGTQPPSLSHDPHNFTNLFSPLVEGGPHVSIIQGKSNGYGAEVERTFFLGHVPEAARRPFDVMMGARQMVFDMAVPGAVMHEVDAAVNRFFESQGYGDNMLHRAGHSFGVTDHEGPFLAEGDYHVIQPNMVFSFEPGIYFPGVGGFRLSDTVVTTENGNRAMTRSPDTLDGLTLPI